MAGLKTLSTSRHSLSSAELFQKGIPNEIIEQALEGIDEEALAFELARSRSDKYRQLDQADYKKKMTGLLARRGFPYPITRHVVDTLWLEIEKEL